MASKAKAPKIATAEELIAKELRRALRRKAKVADEITYHEQQVRQLDQESKMLDKSIEGLRGQLSDQFDAEGKPVEVEA